MKKPTFALTASVTALLAASGAMAADVAIVQGSFYTGNLKAALEAKGHTVAEIGSYTAASLAPYDAVIMYGNTFTDQTELASYVNGGGRLIWTPWAGWNFPVNPELQVFSNGGSNIYFSTPNPGVNVLDAGNALLDGVSFPAAGTINVGYIGGITHVGNAIASWADGSALLGTATYGAGSIVGINLHVITSDTAYEVIDTPWASQLLSNAVGAGVTGGVPEPATWALMIAGFGLVGAAARRRRETVTA